MKKIIAILILLLNICSAQQIIKSDRTYSAENFEISKYEIKDYYQNIYVYSDSINSLYEKVINSSLENPLADNLKFSTCNSVSDINSLGTPSYILFSNNLFFNDSLENVSAWSKVDKVKFYSISGSLLGIGVWFHFKQQNAWWKDRRGPFHIQNDWDYACQLDKVGHFFGGMITTHTVTECYYWAGVERKTSMWIGAACGAAWQTYVEIEDGFGIDWGFSPTDFAADILGAFYPVAQEYWEPLRAVDLKMSYLPSSDLKTGTWKRGIFVKKDTFIDDYQGQMFWLTFNVDYFLPKEYKDYWPDWLQIALGYGLSKWDGDEEFMGRHVTDKELWLSFDYDLEKLPGDGEILRLLKKLFNQFHLPAPAVRLTPGPIWYGLFFAHGL